MRLRRGALPPLSRSLVSRSLIEAQTVEAAGCQRDLLAQVAVAAVPPEAGRLAAELLERSAAEQPVVALALGFEFDRRRLKPDELLRRLIAATLLRTLGAQRLVASPVTYQSRARWDLYSPDAESLVALNHLVEETDALQHVIERHARTVFWSPAPAAGRPAEEWLILRYRARQPWPAERNWFDEVVAQNERQSAERRQLAVDARGLEARLPAVRALLARLDAVLAEGEYLTLAT